MAEENTFQLNGVGGNANSVVGPDIASTTTIAPSYMIHRVSGTTTISTISLPHVNFNGILILIPSSAALVLAGGNIATTTTLTTSVPALLAYHTGAAKWYVK